MSDTSPLWTPTPERVAGSHMQRFLERIRTEYAPSIENYAGLWRWSVEYPELFWPEVWAACGIRASAWWDSVLVDGDRMPGARWFTGARLNFSENLLRFRDEHPALVYRDESGVRIACSHAELYAAVARLAGALRQAGIQPGDRIAGWLPNRPETVIAMLAATSCGAIWSSCSSDFGAAGVLDRFGQIGPRILFAADGYRHAGRTIDMLERLRTVRAGLPSVERVVVVPVLDDAPAIDGIPDCMRWADFQSDATGLRFEQLPFDHPVYILYSSGTTGVPKCIVHGAGGTLIQHLKELVLHTDIGRDDCVFYFTTCGWMMWNWLVSALATGSTVLLYEGAPFHPRPHALWRLAEEERISVFGTSAKYLASLEQVRYAPRENCDLSRLRTVLSTGSPLLPQSYDYVYRDVKADVQLASISGGTDIVSCFALGNPIGPVWRGELQCRGLGLNVEIFDEAGNPLAGQKGELVCTHPFPSMPVGFWNDPDGSRYRAAYFERFPGVWAHGDWAELTEHDGLVIHGRSDATLNPGGVRIGTAEIYRQVERLPEVEESLAIGQRWKGDVRIVLFVRLDAGHRLDDALRQRIRAVLRTEASPRHVPAKIVQVTEIPRTASGKIMELAVANVVHGEPVSNLDAIANPGALEQYRDLPELLSD
jgi:acetoacetyl-CoA synthetase